MARGPVEAPSSNHYRACDKSAEQHAFDPAGYGLTTSAKAAFAEQAAILVEPKAALREYLGQKVEAAAHQSPADHTPVELKDK